MTDTIKEAVRDAYRAAALKVIDQNQGCCEPLEGDDTRFGTELYQSHSL